MLTETSLRRKAHKIGYSVHKGLRRFQNQIAIPREVGYMVKDDRTGFYEWGSYNQYYTHLWELSDVEDFLREEYESLGLEF